MTAADAAPYLDCCRSLARAPQRWLVTGVAGFIGSALAERLLGLGQTVIGLDNFMTGHRENIDDVVRRVGARAARLQLIEGDIRDRDACDLACRGADYVLHQAALGSVPWSLADPVTTHGCNVDGFVNVALAARDAGVRRMVYASSSAVYGDLAVLPHVETRVGEPLSPYGLSKRIDELYAAVYQRAYGLELVGLRYFNVFGRRQDPAGPYAAVIPRWIGLMLQGEPGTIFGAGDTSRDFCPVEDVVQANLLAALQAGPDASAVYNVGTGVGTTLVELYRMVRQAVAAVGVDEQLPPARFSAPRVGDIDHSRADIGAAVAHLGYRPSPDLSAALERTVHWFAEVPRRQ